MKDKYQKPLLITEGHSESVIPAGLAGAVAAFTAGVAAGVQVKKMLNGRVSYVKNRPLVEIKEVSYSI